MKLSYNEWMAMFILLAAISATISSPSFWRYVSSIKRRVSRKTKCQQCRGDKTIYFDGEDITDDCEHCSGSGEINV
jgi:hypothetical protein